MSAELRPLLVRAHLAAGIAQAAPWGIALDGLLAAQLWARTKAARRGDDHPPSCALDVDDPEDLPLPLARCEPTDGPWHWAATCALPEPAPDAASDVHYWTARIDHRHLEQLAASLPANLSERQGRYRARRMPLLVTPCRSVVWHAVGDPAGIEDLVADLTAIGKKRAHGEGHVLRWEVLPQPDLDPWAAAHLHPDGTLGRPTPESCLTGRGVVRDGGRGTAGIRPPYVHRSRQHALHLPALLDAADR